MENKIKYEHYILMHRDEEDKQNMPNPIIREMSVSFIEYFRYLLDDNFHDFEEELRNGIEINKWKTYTQDDIIESVFAKTDMDRQKKKKDRNYYVYNALCAREIIKFIFTEDLYNSLKNGPSIATHSYYHILKYLLLDAGQLVNEYQNNIKDNYQFNANAHRPIHAMEIHNVLRQGLYGTFSFHSFSDMEIDASIAVIRQLIELRMRRAFGTIAYIDQNDNIKPLDMSKLFEVLKEYEKEIEWPIKLSSIERIYKWGNLYIHSGTGDYTWLPYFVEKYLRNLSFGKMNNNSWSYSNGFKTKQEVIDKIQAKLLDGTANLQILKCKPECEILK